MQILAFPLPTKTWAASGNDVIPLRDIPISYQGRPLHLIAVQFAVELDPSFTTAPTTVGLNKSVINADFWDGNIFRFQGGFNEMRWKEMIENGGIVVPDSDNDGATGVVRHFRRTLSMGPANFAGNPTDFAIPLGMLQQGEIRLRYGALTDISADCTVNTGIIRPTAFCIQLDEVRIPPAYQFLNQSLTANDVNISGRALYNTLQLLNDGLGGAITAGDFANFTLELGSGPVVPGVDCEVLTAMRQYVHQTGEIGGYGGEPRSSIDDNGKIVNRATPTALVAEAANIQDILVTGKGTKISKLQLAESVCRLRWTGTQTTGVLLVSRILAQPQSVVTALASKALARLGVNGKDVKIKTLSKRAYSDKGPLKEFMPWKVAI